MIKRVGAALLWPLALALLFIGFNKSDPYLIALRGSGDVLVLVLAGIVVGALAGAAISLVKVLADPYDQLPAITFWLLGSLAGVKANDVAATVPVVLIGLAAKNAILIVEFARQGEAEGRERREAAIAAARTRLRPILMTSFAFVFGVVPLAIARGAGAEMRQSLGTAVFFGMIGVTFFGLLFTPLFYVVCRRLGEIFAWRRKPQPAPDPGPAE